MECYVMSTLMHRNECWTMEKKLDKNIFGDGKEAGSYGDVAPQKNVKTVMDKESYK